jgi:hypothetical protein
VNPATFVFQDQFSGQVYYGALTSRRRAGYDSMSRVCGVAILRWVLRCALNQNACSHAAWWTRFVSPTRVLQPKSA